jgi:hypothetical protein
MSSAAATNDPKKIGQKVSGQTLVAIASLVCRLEDALLVAKILIDADEDGIYPDRLVNGLVGLRSMSSGAIGIAMSTLDTEIGLIELEIKSHLSRLAGLVQKMQEQYDGEDAGDPE